MPSVVECAVGMWDIQSAGATASEDAAVSAVSGKQHALGALEGMHAAGQQVLRCLLGVLMQGDIPVPHLRPGQAGAEGELRQVLREDLRQEAALSLQPGQQLLHA